MIIGGVVEALIGINAEGKPLEQIAPPLIEVDTAGWYAPEEAMNVTVVVGVDYSEASKEALRLAAQEARWRQAPLIAVSAYEPPIGPVGGFPGSAMHTEGEQRATSEAELRATVDEELGDQAAQTELRVSAGLAGRVIVETARQTRAQLVVLAARTGMAVVPGTVSQYVLLKSHCPVTIVPHDGKDEERDDNQS